MRCSEEGAVWSDESARSNGDNACIQEGAVEVDIDTLSNSGKYVLLGGSVRGGTQRDAPQIGTIINFNRTINPCIAVKELVIRLLRERFGGEGRLIAKNTRIWLIRTRYHTI